MEILCHRGMWEIENEKNSFNSLLKAISNGFGIETDIRDFNNELVISHDIPNTECIRFYQFLEEYSKSTYFENVTLALNIKADGLQNKLMHLLEVYKVKNYFVFDMSIPETVNYSKNEIRFFIRQSEYEIEPIQFAKMSGIWLDAFNSEWYDIELINNHILNNREVAIVSPELHKRDYLSLWKRLKENNIHNSNLVKLCTDLPKKAMEYFYE